MLSHPSRLLFRLLPLVTALLFSAAPGHAQGYAYVKDFKANPAQSLDVSGANVLKVSNRILVPTLYLRVTTSGSVFAAKSAGSSTASAKGSFVVHGHERAELQALSKQLYDEFVARLRADGWEVLTFDDIKNDAGIAAMERRTGSGSLNFTEEKESNGCLYAVVPPSDAQNFKPAFQGPTWPFRFIAKERNATVLIPQLDIYAPQVWAETRKGYKSATAEIKALPGMNLNYAMVIGLSPKGGGALIKLKHAILNPTENAGTFTNAEDKSPKAGNALSKGLSILGGGGNISRASSSYSFTIDPPAFREGVLAGSRPFLDGVAQALAPQLTKG